MTIAYIICFYIIGFVLSILLAKHVNGLGKRNNHYKLAEDITLFWCIIWPLTWLVLGCYLLNQWIKE